MKKRILFFLLFLPLLIAGCGTKENTTDKMTDEEVLKVLDVKIHKHPKDADLLCDRARVYLRMGQTNAAIGDLTRAVSINEKESSYHKLLADAYFANGDMEHSYECLQRVLELDPKDDEAYLKLGEIAYYSKDYDRAMEHLSRVTAGDPNNRTALFMKGFIYEETGDTSSAVKLFHKVCELYPEYEAAFEHLGALYAARHNPMALEYLNTAHRLEPENTQVLYILAMYYQEKNVMDKAEQIYQQILDIDDNHKHAWHNRGYIQLFTYGDYPEAVRLFTRAIQCDSAFIEAWTNRGCAYELMDDKSNARQDFLSALNIDHTFEPALDGLARVKGKAG